MWALMLFPAILWRAACLEERPSILNLLLFGVVLSALITSHNLSAFVFLPIILIWTVLLFWKRKNKKFIWLSLGSVVIGVMLSAFYLLPAFFEKNLVHLETMVEGYFSYTEHFKGVKKLFLERSWEYGSSIREVPGGERDGMSYQIGWVHLLGWLLALISVKLLWRKNKIASVMIVFFSTVILFSVFLIHPKSEFIWRKFEPGNQKVLPKQYDSLSLKLKSSVPSCYFYIPPASLYRQCKLSN